jgi:hypothetical protein
VSRKRLSRRIRLNAATLGCQLAKTSLRHFRDDATGCQIKVISNSK